MGFFEGGEQIVHEQYPAPVADITPMKSEGNYEEGLKGAERLNI